MGVLCRDCGSGYKSVFVGNHRTIKRVNFSIHKLYLNKPEL